MHANANLLGRLGQDPELRYTQSGKAVCNLSLAVDQFDREADPDWWKLTLWEKQAEFAATHLAKGARVFVEGRPGMEEWEDGDGGHHAKLSLSVRTLQVIDWADDDAGEGAEGAEAGPQADRTAPRPAPSRTGPSKTPAAEATAAKRKRFNGLVSKHGNRG